MLRRWLAFALIPLIALVLAVASCAPSAGPGGGREQAAQPKPARTLVIVSREVTGLAAKRLQGTSGSIETAVLTFNAGLDRRDETGSTAPYLAEALPQLHTDSWQVFPDGRMETRYRLKPNLTWHDGAPLTADDFRFAWQVYATPAFGTNGAR